MRVVAFFGLATSAFFLSGCGKCEYENVAKAKCSYAGLSDACCTVSKAANTKTRTVDEALADLSAMAEKCTNADDVKAISEGKCTA